MTANCTDITQSDRQQQLWFCSYGSVFRPRQNTANPLFRKPSSSVESKTIHANRSFRYIIKTQQTQLVFPPPLTWTGGPRRSSTRKKPLRNRKAKLVHACAAPSGPSLSSEEETDEEARVPAEALGEEDPGSDETSSDEVFSESNWHCKGSLDGPGKLLHVSGNEGDVQVVKVSQIRTSVYHPQTDGLIERFNKTLKQMLRKVIDVDGKNWDQLIPFVLFSIQEVPQASTGFSPFELLYGRRPRGMLDLAKEAWEKQPSPHRSVIEYVDQMQERMAKIWPLVREHMQLAQQA
ncbi:hypothetical protein F2P81_002404 [Scophthalmus maximus]|uniref:Integrase catalytic domain-containing protein n=1 Tax=Scophthalmus maximus TaxID=52904 RepID=A0A6A4TKW4_SCOMX|nr:hypothetical protein F2P81_002404 [Scophthalmus maximus]